MNTLRKKTCALPTGTSPVFLSISHVYSYIEVEFFDIFLLSDKLIKIQVPVLYHGRQPFLSQLLAFLNVRAFVIVSIMLVICDALKGPNLSIYLYSYITIVKYHDNVYNSKSVENTLFMNVAWH